MGWFSPAGRRRASSAPLPRPAARVCVRLRPASPGAQSAFASEALRRRFTAARVSCPPRPRRIPGLCPGVLAAQGQADDGPSRPSRLQFSSSFAASLREGQVGAGRQKFPSLRGDRGNYSGIFSLFDSFLAALQQRGPADLPGHARGCRRLREVAWSCPCAHPKLALLGCLVHGRGSLFPADGGHSHPACSVGHTGGVEGCFVTPGAVQGCFGRSVSRFPNLLWLRCLLWGRGFAEGSSVRHLTEFCSVLFHVSAVNLENLLSFP